MKAVFEIMITVRNVGIPEQARKEVEINFTPTVGMYVEDPAWSSQVTAVRYEIGSDVLNVVLGTFETKDQDDQLSAIKTFRQHGWKIDF